MKLRTGRKVPRTLYVQMGDEPDDKADIDIGYIRFPAVAQMIVEQFNGQPGSVLYVPNEACKELGL